ncbi:MAG: sugar MFS transporter [Flammeovirgaceae bacterium]|nr:sugar MFS transporter [Flammeovirgaceae bacterium]
MACYFPLAIDGLGRFTKIGSALLIMGIAGGAIIPQIYGYLSEIISFQSAFFYCIVPCYLFIWYYAVKGFRAGKG